MPAVIREADDRDTLLLGLVENVAREDLSPIEEARAYAILLDEFGLSLGEVAERVGKSKPTVSNRVRLLELPERRARARRPRRADGGPCPRAARRSPTTSAPPARAADRARRDVGAVGRARGARPPAPRRASGGRARSIPALAQRVRDAFRTLTGFDAKVGRRRPAGRARRRRPARGARRGARAAARRVTGPGGRALHRGDTRSGSTISRRSRRSRRTTTPAASSCAWRSCRRTAA